MQYRREIDGLRALAVVPVIFFHAGYELFRGGYLGVDVFFVISGYLITSILLENLEDGEFSIFNFYERRARRILPALVFVCVVSVPLAYAFMAPPQFVDFGRTLTAIALFASNFVFWQQSGYFGSEAERNPLIHTWSLAVEEQFYLLFPVMLWILWRFGLVVVAAVIFSLALASLALSEWAAVNKPLASFFLAPTRLWELFAGSLCAILLFRRAVKPSEMLSGLGLTLIVSAMATFDPSTPVPSLWAVWPIGGVCLVILYCDGTTTVGRFLSLRSVVVVGLLSYSAYLWHQPILAFLRLCTPEPPEWAKALAVLSVLTLAALTWRYVEQPFRTGYGMPRLEIGRRGVFTSSFAALAIVFAAGQFVVAKEGFPGRLTLEQRQILALRHYERRDQIYRSGVCFLDPAVAGLYAPECTAEGASYAIWGDSHAGALTVGFRALANQVSQYTAGRCAPVVGFDTWGSETCISRNDQALREFSRSQPAVIVMHANWSGYLDDLGMVGHLQRTIDQVLKASPSSRIWLVGSMPQWKPSLPELYVRAGRTLAAPSTFEMEGLMLRRLKYFDEVLASIAAARERVSFHSLLDVLCDKSDCLSAVANGDRVETLVWDYGHLTELGSIEVARRLLTTENRFQAQSWR